MERALNHDELTRALGGRAPFPSASEVATAIGTAELQLMAGGGEVSRDLLQMAWYLHGVGSVRGAVELYGVERQRAADRVAAHVFDLSLRAASEGAAGVRDGNDWLRRCFAAQVSYVRSELDPNALAMYRRERIWRYADVGLLPVSDRPALIAGSSLLGGDVAGIFEYCDRIIAEAAAIEERWNVESLEQTPLGPPLSVVQAVRDITVHLVYGREGALEIGQERLVRLVTRTGPILNRDARWVAALLLDLLDGLDRTSVRSVMPPDTPDAVTRAFTVVSPPILTLWPPQTRLLGAEGGRSVLDPEAKRMLVSAPTSAGKTLTAQLLIASHLATRQAGVCYVAPTRSLCREVERSLQQRLRYIAQDVTSGLPEWGLPAGFEADRLQLEVMTPERLAYLLRAEGRALLDRFGLFVIDEVHNIADGGRGWTLESDLTYLHEATAHTDHRIVLISAAVSNRAHFVSWLRAADGEPVDFHSDWRGPRRLHALWTTDADWSREAPLPRPRSNSPERRGIPLTGRLLVRDPGTGRVIRLSWDEDVGQLVLRTNDKKDESSTTVYRTVVPVVGHLAGLGPVLVVESTRKMASLMARAIADAAPEAWEGDQNLIDAAQSLLGEEHELTQVLRKGVAFHHGALPTEIRLQIEEAVRDGALRVLVSTTTLTEGVNLPVRSVVIASRGAHGPDGYNEYINGAALLNAIGRAGRAAIETEGYVVIAATGSGDPVNSFKLFEPDDEELVVRSALATVDALAELAKLEDAARASVDEVYEASGKPADFISFVWFIASELERRGEEVTDESVTSMLHYSLGWTQLDEAGRDLWVRVAQTTAQAYRNAPAERRRRWATAGMSVGSARTLEAVAREVAAEIPPDADPLGTEDALDLVFAEGRLERLLRLPEAPRANLLVSLALLDDPRGLKLLASLLKDWMRGFPLRVIADEHLGSITDVGRRLEKLVDVVAKYFELFLPWAMSEIVGQANELLNQRLGDQQETGDPDSTTQKLPDTVAAYIRWGVNDPTALRLILRGVLSRRLAMRISAAWGDVPDEMQEDVFQWLGDLRVTDWAGTFETTPAELRNLLYVVRPWGSEFAADVLHGDPISLQFHAEGPPLPTTGADLRLETEGEIGVIGVWARGRRLGFLSGRHHGDIAGFLEGGLTLASEAESDGETGRLTIRLVEP